MVSNRLLELGFRSSAQLSLFCFICYVYKGISFIPQALLGVFLMLLAGNLTIYSKVRIFFYKFSYSLLGGLLMLLAHLIAF